MCLNDSLETSVGVVPPPQGHVMILTTMHQLTLHLPFVHDQITSGAKSSGLDELVSDGFLLELDRSL
jgi:hypothetical protein